ncbi:oligosaccharyl transferase, archaeosortase A system-associated [Natronosalvus halobius]|uniref:oligosaccharyl transferase, archaeosortase A system-associated n=1 Tax=Natronosalvus halobius TaxID=2953746 RepID=UPI0020A1C3A8|nr:oligosaccharyl transferase, archaeosortase A system-associated [Natronosalvus halobius]USZ71579.1 oligosaccharyl transferase, archaeosortase A system-associated [Natronosalvus halobius]
MSTETERVDTETRSSPLRIARRWYHVPLLAVVMAFMLWTRLRSYDSVAMRNGQPRLSGVDSWYHWRAIQWTAENYPRTMPFEVWTGYPTGNYVGQFGTLFDQLIVTAAMVVGLGDPSTQTLYTVSIVAIPLMAALVAIPVFYMGRRLGGTIGGLVSVVLLALTPGSFFYRSAAGQLDHHIGEVLFMAIAVLAMMVAVRSAEQDRPIWELVEARDWDALRRPTLYSVAAGVALSLYIWIWPAGVVLTGIFGVFFLVALCLQYLRGASPDHLAFVGVISMGLTAIFTLVLLEEPGSSPTSFSYIQPLVAAAVAVGSAFMAWFARLWDGRSLERQYYPVAVLGLVGLAFLLMAVVLPDIFGTITSNLSRRLLPFGESATDLTISEAQPPDDFTQYAFNEFGAAFFTMLGGLAFLVLRPLFGREWRAEYTLVIVWSLFLISMAATQTRFSYYLAIAVAVVNAVFVADIARLLSLDFHRTADSIRDVETYQVIAIVLVVMMLFMPLLPPIAADGATTWERGDNVGPNGNAMTWDESTQWLLESTPEPGNWAGAGNQSELEYYGTYDRPADGDFDYPGGAYGVMSWWDYGHLITTNGERIPHSNPFQQNARSSSWYLLAEEESHGEAILDGIAADVPVVNQPEEAITAELENADSVDEGEMRYVMIDDEMAGGKFSAITQWTDPAYSRFQTQETANLSGQEFDVPTTSEAYHDTMLASLYLHDAEGMDHYRLVHESSSYSVVGTQLLQTPNGLYPVTTRSGTFFGAQPDDVSARLEEARALNRPTAFNGYAVELGGRYYPAYAYNAYLVSDVKTFERVEGATITGSVDGEVAESDRVYAQVELETEPGRTFTYTQQANVSDDGTFELTVPYATNDELGPEDGYTDSAVEAIDDEYEIFVGTPEDGEIERQYLGTTAVPETAVVDGEDLEVTLEEGDGEVVPDPDAEAQPPEGEDENVSDGENETDDDEIADDEADDGSDENGSENVTDDGNETETDSEDENTTGTGSDDENATNETNDTPDAPTLIDPVAPPRAD